MPKESIYFRIGKRIGYWYAANRHELHQSIVRTVLHRLPGGRWISRFFR